MSVTESKAKKVKKASPKASTRKADVQSDVLVAVLDTPDVMVEYFQSGVPVATPTTFLTNVNTMETWPLLQGAAGTGEFRSRLDEVLRMALDRQAGKSLSPPSQGQQ